MKVSKQCFQDFLKGYTEAMLWCNTYGRDWNETRDHRGQPLSRVTQRQASRDCRRFLVGLGVAHEKEFESALVDQLSFERMGVCFALSRNRHGAGFFDFGCNLLQTEAKLYGECLWCMNSRGRIVPMGS